MTHKNCDSPSIVNALVELACANRLEFIAHDQYKDSNGNILTQTELGYIDTEYFNYKLMYHELQDDLKELESELKALKGERKTLALQNRELSGKTALKIQHILDSNVSDKEKLQQIKKYLG